MFTPKSARAVAMPSSKGHWATTAAMRGSWEATTTTWPPLKELPKSATRAGSTQSSRRPQAMAAW